MALPKIITIDKTQFFHYHFNDKQIIATVYPRLREEIPCSNTGAKGQLRVTEIVLLHAPRREPVRETRFGAKYHAHRQVSSGVSVHRNISERGLPSQHRFSLWLCLR